MNIPQQHIMKLLEDGFQVRRIDGRCGDGFVDLTALNQLVAAKQVRVIKRQGFEFITTLPKPKPVTQRPRGTSVTREEFKRAHTTVRVATDNKARGKAVRLNLVRKNGFVDWTCTTCGERNHHKDMGRDIYVCSHCSEGIELK